MHTPTHDNIEPVKFYNHKVLNTFLSSKEAKPAYQDTLFVRIANPGDRLNIIDRPATDQDKRAHWKQFQKFENLAELATDGTPLELILAANPELLRLLKEHNIHTVEYLAEVQPSIWPVVGIDGEKIQAYAQRYMNAVAKGSEYEALKAENTSLREKIAEQARTIENLSVDLVNIRERFNVKPLA